MHTLTRRHREVPGSSLGGGIFYIFRDRSGKVYKPLLTCELVMPKVYVKIIMAALVVLAVSGCLNAELNTKINKDFSGTRTMHLEIARMLYPYLENNLSRESISSVNGATLVSYKKDIKNDKVILDIVVNYKDLRSEKDIRISEHDGILRYEDFTFESIGKTEATSMSGAVSINYSVEMPYKIENSNADNIEGYKATWIMAGPTYKTLYAESKIPVIPGFILTEFTAAGLLLLIILRVGKVGR